MTEQECLKALCRIQCGAQRSKKCEDCECFDDKVNIWKCVENTQESLVLRQLIREHFELVKKYDELYERHSKILDDVHDYRYETQSLKIIIRNLCKHFGVESEKELQNIYLNKPYKFEDLKVGMWLWDIIWEECFEICEIFPKDNEIHVLIHKNRINVKRYEPIKFEEGRFFPVTKAMEYQK